MVDSGHKHIGFIGVSLSEGLRLRRFQGYLEALKDHGLTVDEQLIVGGRDVNGQMPGYSTEEMGFDGMMKLLGLKQRPTAVFARNDFTAMGALNAIKRAGLRIPDDIALMGYDDIPLASHTSPALTTVRQPTREQGRCAAEFLLRRVEGDREQPRAEKTFQCELIVRESTTRAGDFKSGDNRKRKIKTA